jgi:hypothetical protein
VVPDLIEMIYDLGSYEKFADSKFFLCQFSFKHSALQEQKPVAFFIELHFMGYGFYASKYSAVPIIVAAWSKA